MISCIITIKEFLNEYIWVEYKMHSTPNNDRMGENQSQSKNKIGKMLPTGHRDLGTSDDELLSKLLNIRFLLCRKLFKFCVLLWNEEKRRYGAHAGLKKAPIIVKNFLYSTSAILRRCIYHHLSSTFVKRQSS